MRLVSRLKALWAPPSGNHGNRRRADFLTALKENYHDLSRFAEHLRVHADLAPYPGISKRLKEIAAEKEASAGRLREVIAGLGATVEDETGFAPFKGMNHWERMVRDLEDQRNLEDHLAQDRIFLAEQGSAEVSALLADIAATEASHRSAFLDFLAKADPQATQT